MNILSLEQFRIFMSNHHIDAILLLGFRAFQISYFSNRFQSLNEFCWLRASAILFSWGFKEPADELFEVTVWAPTFTGHFLWAQQAEAEAGAGRSCENQNGIRDGRNHKNK